jgi:streptogramin lyase
LEYKIRSRASRIAAASQKIGGAVGAFAVVLGLTVADASAQAITEFPINEIISDPNGITTGPDGALWFTEYESGKIDDRRGGYRIHDPDKFQFPMGHYGRPGRRAVVC